MPKSANELRNLYSNDGLNTSCYYSILTVNIKSYFELAIPAFPDIGKKRLSPNTIRHTTAIHLLKSGVDINKIRAWLCHVSINTTNVYAEVNLGMKAKAFACCKVAEDKKKRKPW